LDAVRAQASAPDTGAPAAPVVASDGSSYSGGLLGRLVAMAGLDPQNPNRLAPPQGDGLRGFYGDDAVQPWALQRSR